ncbi:MAG: TldD/PmbA family protein [Christensenellaceae bacterium]|nr:TldD/PmbA family protein [Christensenellaceae bacterium]
MIGEATAQRVLGAALATGGDFAEIFLEDTETRAIAMLDGKVETAAYRRRCGAGVRVLLGEQCAYAYTAGIGEAALIDTARAAAAILAGKSGTASQPFGPKRVPPVDIARPFSSVGNAERIALLSRGTAAAKAVSPEVSRVTANYADVDQRVCICNSRGLWAGDRRPRTRLSFDAIASSGGEYQTGGERPALGMGFEAYERIDPEAAGKQAAQTAVTMLHAPNCPAGMLPVVIDGGFGGVILHEACVHSLEATAVAKGNSEFCGKLGQQIASAKVTAIDDGTLAGEWGSLRVDDEGEPTRRNVLIQDGVLQTYLVDILGGRIMGRPVTGSARRESYCYAPTSRMTNTFFAPGTDDEEEMIATMGEGLFAKRMGGGSVNPLTGEFNFAVLEGYWVKAGKIVTPVRGASLVGRGADVLQKIDRIGRHMWMGYGMCGSKSGSVPTNVGQPRIRVSSMTIGGKGENL